MLSWLAPFHRLFLAGFVFDCGTTFLEVLLWTLVNSILNVFYLHSSMYWLTWWRQSLYYGGTEKEQQWHWVVPLYSLSNSKHVWHSCGLLKTQPTQDGRKSSLHKVRVFDPVNRTKVPWPTFLWSIGSFIVQISLPINSDLTPITPNSRKADPLLLTQNPMTAVCRDLHVVWRRTSMNLCVFEDACLSRNIVHWSNGLGLFFIPDSSLGRLLFASRFMKGEHFIKGQSTQRAGMREIELVAVGENMARWDPRYTLAFQLVETGLSRWERKLKDALPFSIQYPVQPCCHDLVTT